MIIAQYGFIGIGVAWIALLMLLVVYIVGIFIGWLCASGLRRESPQWRWFDLLVLGGFIPPAFWIWLELIRANRAIYDSGHTAFLASSLAVAISIGIIVGLINFLLVPGHRKRLSSEKQHN